MSLENYFEIGRIIKPHGLKGALNIQFDVDDPAEYSEMESVLVENDSDLIPFFISTLQINGNKGIIKLEEINAIDEANELKKCRLFLPIETLPKLNDDQFYYHDVIGYTITDKIAGKLGAIKNIFTGGNQDLIEMSYKGKDILIPIADDIVGKADHQQKQLFVDLPDGLLDIYL